MNKYFRAAGFLAVLAFVLAAAGCEKGGERGRFGMRPGRHLDAGRAERMVKIISKKLDLTDAQKAGLDKIKDSILAKQKEMEENAERAKSMEEIAGIIKSDKIDRAGLIKLIEAKEAQVKGMRDFMIDKLIEFHALLTPEQRQKLAEKISEFGPGCPGKKHTDKGSESGNECKK